MREAFKQMFTRIHGPHRGALAAPGSKRTMILGTVLALGVVAAPRTAPAAEVADSSAGEATGQLNEIVITSRKRQENLQNVPISVKAFTAKELESRSLYSLSDVAQETSNLTFGQDAQSGSSASIVYIRGVGQSDPLATFNPGVGIYMDGVYLGRMTGIDLDMMDVERVEVLRGPQGTLFGKNTNGGAISIVTKQPDINASSSSGRVEAIGGSLDRSDVIGNLDVPIAQGKAAIDFAFARRHQEGYSTRIDGQQQANTDKYLGRISLLVMLTDRLKLDWSVDGTTYNQGTSAFWLVDVRTGSTIPMLDAALTPYRYDTRWVSRNPFFYEGTGPNVNDGRLYGTAATFTWNLGNATLKSISAFRNNRVVNDEDPDGSPLAVLNVFEPIHQHQFSQELQLTGKSFDSRLKWVGGLYYFTENVVDDNSYQVAEEFFHGAADFYQNLQVKNDSYAAYGQGTYSLTDKLSMTLGGRVTHDFQRVARQETGQASIAPTGDWNYFLPRFDLDYHFNSSVMSYFSISKGSKGGGFNGRASSVLEFNRFDPEKVWTYEVGLRSELMDHRLRMNATAFYSRYVDMQVQINASVTDPVTGQPVPYTYVANIPSAAIKGGELEIAAIPIHGLSLSANLGVADGRYLSVLPGAPMTTQDDFINTPKVTYGLSAEYGLQLPAEYRLAGRVDWSHKSRIEYDYGNSPLVAQNPYGLLNARLTLDVGSTGLSLALFGTNLTNSIYAVGGHDDGVGGSLGFVVKQMGAPREWGISGKYQF